MKSTSVRGTPFRSISADNGQGFMTPGAKPKAMSGVVPKQYEGEQATNQANLNGRAGTPYQSRSVNDDREPPLRTKKYGNQGDSINGQGDMNNPDDNGDGTLFDGVNEHGDFVPPQGDVMDSPVPTGAQIPQTDAAEVLANLRSGVGKEWGPSDGPGNNFQTMGGVMSRDMAQKSTAKGAETELLEDDYLRDLGPGGAKK